MTSYLDVTQEAGRAFVQRGIAGPVAMLNLLRLRAVADYAHAPELAPEAPISGRAAYDLYIAQTRPILEQSGGRILFLGDGGPFLIGPPDERWDLAMLVEQQSVASFLSHADNPALQVAMAHRTAALEDARLLPLAPLDLPA